MEGGVGGQWKSERCSAEPQFLKGTLAERTPVSWEGQVHCVSHQNRDSEAKKQDEGRVAEQSFREDRILRIGCMLNEQVPRSHQVTLELCFMEPWSCEVGMRIFLRLYVMVMKHKDSK